MRDALFLTFANMRLGKLKELRLDLNFEKTMLYMANDVLNEVGNMQNDEVVECRRMYEDKLADVKTKEQTLEVLYSIYN